ncbi:hypothetical protein L6164_017450 [Bauhinia variegata]|nr:hypothetical protein L6164_017450 [Bauhinia variegata]
MASKPASEVLKPTAEAKAQLASPISNTQPASQLSKPTGEALKPSAEKATQPASPSRLASASFVSQQQKEKMTSFEPVSQQSKPKTKSPLKAIPNPQEQNQAENPEKVSNGNSKSPLDSQDKFLKPEEREKMAPRPIKEAKAKDPTSSQSQSIRRKTTTKLHTTASTSSTFQSDKKPEETTEKKLKFSTSNPSGNDLRVVSSTEPTNKNISTISLQKDIREEVSKFVQKLADEHPKQNTDDDEKSVSIITIAGDNRGATMQIGSESSKKEESVHIHRAYKTNPDESPEVTTDEEEGESSGEESQSGKEKDEEGKAYVNSNVQSINNSLMFHGSIAERDPGVQLIFPQNKQENAQKAQEKPAFVTRKLTYQPTVRRRCLRGLFLEPSDSDPDNPEKPRRHGCKFRCGENKEEKDTESM